MPALNDVLTARLAAFSPDRRRVLMTSQPLAGGRAAVDGKVYQHFCGNDYLGLSHDIRLIEAAQNACNSGSGAGASRLVTGNHAGYEGLEVALAKHSGHATALVFSSGYAATVGTIAALMGKGDLILADKLAHACMIDGAMLSGATLKRFAHNDMGHAEALLQRYRRQYQSTLIITEHIFSMDGDAAPLDALVKLKNTYDTWLMVDDAHGISVTDYPHKNSVDIWCGTLSKALASVGGYVCGSAALRDYLIQHARSLIFSTALPPAALAAAHTALEVVKAEPWRGAQALLHAQRFAQALDLPQPHAAIVPLILGENARALEASAALKMQGYLVSAIRPPTVPKGAARLRFTFSAAHSDDQVNGVIAATKKWVKP